MGLKMNHDYFPGLVWLGWGFTLRFNDIIMLVWGFSRLYGLLCLLCLACDLLMEHFVYPGGSDVIMAVTEIHMFLCGHQAV